MMKKNKLNKEEIAEDYCFTCKDGGHLRVCDFKFSYVPIQFKLKFSYFQGKVDFRDTETYEFLFKDYWEIIKDQEGLTLIDLQAANALLKRGENYKGGSDSDKLAEEDVESEGDDLEINSDDGLSFLEDLKGRCGRMKKPIKRSRSKKKVFISWGSVELINFLISVGRDTNEPLTLLDACEIIKDYIDRNNLHDPDTKKKKNVICDERLYALFRKRKVKFHKIECLLESHFATNDDSDEEISFSSEDGGTFGRRKKQNTGYDEHKLQPKEYMEDISAAPKSCYASIVRKNINSVYLKRSLIMEFLKSPDTFEEKVTGCFVRVKVDPEDFYFVPEKRYKLGQVTGVKKALQTYKVGTMSTDVVLRVSNYHADVQLFFLSDDDFDEAELENKIRSVHADIMNHLRTSEERKRLLQEIPTVVADISQTKVKNTNGPPISSECQLPKAADVNNSGSGHVIEIEEDHGVQDSKITGNMRISVHVDDEDKTWHYVDPSGNEQGPFDMVSLSLLPTLLSPSPVFHETTLLLPSLEIKSSFLRHQNPFPLKPKLSSTPCSPISLQEFQSLAVAKSLLSAMPVLKIRSCLFLLLISALALEASVSETPSAYEMLEKFDFPKGILPEGVKSYVLNGDGGFEVYLSGNCEFKVEGGYILKYGRKITGKVKSGSLTDLKGVSVKVLFAWFGINEVVRNDSDISFYVGPLSASFPVSNFDECPRCSCGFDCATALPMVS
ncbi:hypothetical protein C4D60_Mb01t09920 [Musa balbisiana]|uniref:Uncharacterized protein n=1 Tax=Musa balbisiana TaxID=52838 RepID=A0A4S8JLE8_MUSBA|nr:hypothetical protein C4D60_Mb01t09920 [Musa balbisiana]